MDKPNGWKISNRKIFKIEGSRVKFEVGEVTDINHEEVIAILESNAYLVCTYNRGVKRGDPILVGTHEVSFVVDYEDETEITPPTQID